MDNSEQTLYGIPISDIKSQVQYDGGVYITTSSYSFYVPNDVTDSTSAVIYYPGAGGAGNDAAPIRKILEEKSPEQIIVIPNSAYEEPAEASTKYLHLINSIAYSESATITDIQNYGFSAGGRNAIQGLVNTISSNPDLPPQKAVIIDAGYNCKSCGLTQEQINVLLDNDASIIFFEETNGGTSSHNVSNLAKAGVDVIVAWAGSGHGAHVQINKEVFANDIINYATGRSDQLLNYEIYTFRAWNPEIQNWETISIDEVVKRFVGETIDLSNPYRYYEKLSTIEPLESSNSFLGDKINGLRASIRNTNFLSNTSGVYYDSTTNIPNVENDIIQSFFTSTSMLLNLLEKDTEKIIAIGNSIEDMNNQLTVEANDLNDVVDTTTTTNQSTDQVYSNQTNNTQVSNPNINVPVVNKPGNSQVVVDNTNAVVAMMVTSISKTVLDLEDTIEEKYDVDITYDDKTTIDKNLIEEFLKYDELYSNDNMIVYDGEDGKYKVVIHYKDGVIKGLEYCYNLGDKKTATSAMELMEEDFDNLESISQDGQYVKLTFKDDVYKDIGLEELKNVYSDFDELRKPEV